MPFTLAHLPTELLEMIATALVGEFAHAYSAEGQVICTLRSTCREARDKLDTKFFSTYFTSRYFWLEERKLAELDAISQRPNLADRLTELSVVCKADPGDLADAFEAGRSLIAPGGIAKSLTVILQRLPNLRSLEFLDVAPERVPPVQISLDVSSTFAAVMLALEFCTCTVKRIRFLADDLDNADAEWRVVGMPEARTLLCLSPSLAMLEYLDLSIVCAPMLKSNAVNALKTGSELAIALRRCSRLKTLVLRMLYAHESLLAFGALASAVDLPGLQSFQLNETSCTVHDLGIFLLRNAASLRHLSLENVSFEPSSPAVFTNLLSLAHDSLKLTKIEASQLTLCAQDGSGKLTMVGFPPMTEAFCDDDPDEDDFLFVGTKLLLEGTEGLQTGLAQMKACVTYTPT
ncbi:hypothetical protein LTR17_013742 [Elasticomyces elasticus]|nr:hypothetical protein LTR17_013742 [Elasticomyces elasticus]